MKRNRRILSLLLAICLVAALIPAVSAAQDIVPAEFAQDDQIVSFAGKDWILLDSNAEEIVLFLQTPEAPIAYNASGLSNAWAGSNAKAWCDEFAAEYGIAYEVTFLSHEEVVTYWTNNSADNLKTENGWWLRYNAESVDSELFGIAVSDAGFVGFPHVATNYGARPAVKIPVSDIAALVYEGSKYEVILIDETASAGFAANMSFDATSKTVTVSYENAAASSDVYVIVTDQLGKIVTSVSQAADGADLQVALSDNLVGRYTVRIFNAVGNVAGPVVEKEFTIADSLGNVTEWNINLGGDISANFNVVLSNEIKADANAKIAVKINENTTEVDIADLPKGTTTDGVECVVVSVKLHAPQMNDAITIQVIDGNNNAGGEQAFSICQYAEAIIDGDFDDSTKELVKHMLNYGAKAQTYFEYNAEDLANVNVTGLSFVDVPAVGDEHKANIVGEIEGIKFYGASLVLNSRTTLRFYFELSDGKAISDYNFGELNVYSRTVGDKKLYFVDIADIAPNELNEAKTVSINGSPFVSYNPMAYIVRTYANNSSNVALYDLMHALYNFHVAAYAYAN